MHSQIELHRAMLEAARLGKYIDGEEYRFCRMMADIYDCIPVEADGDNLYSFLSVIYHYGRIQGIRQERAKRKRQQAAREVAEITRVLNENPLLYQVMKTAAELNSVEPLIDAANFLKGAKKNED